jgi:hypothetical protein
MSLDRARIVASWADVVRRAITLGEADAAYRLTVGAVRRCRELFEVRI